MHFRRAFTMIELMFVIVVIGILAAVAIPRMSGTINDANVAKAKSDVAALRSVIASERQARFLTGSSGYISRLDQGVANNAANVTIFDDNDSNTTNGSLLTYGIRTGTGSGHWIKSAANKYDFIGDGVSAKFTYDSASGRFDCNRSADANGTFCKSIVD